MATPILSVTREQLEAAIGDVEDSTGRSVVDGEWQVLPAYSGRYMYGAVCLAVAGDEALAVALIVALCEQVGQEPRDVITELAMGERWRHDSLGLDTLTYWPGIVVEGINSDEDL
jgi:hypothetical protein